MFLSKNVLDGNLVKTNTWAPLLKNINDVALTLTLTTDTLLVLEF